MTQTIINVGIIDDDETKRSQIMSKLRILFRAPQQKLKKDMRGMC